MNRNNLSWVDNRVLNNPGNTQSRPSQTAPQQVRPYMDTMPAQYQDMPATQNTTAVSPSTYQEPTPKNYDQTGLSPVQQQMDMSMDPARMGVSMPSVQSPGTQGTLTRTEAHDQNPFNMQGPPTVMSPGYLPAYLRSIIGKRVRAEFVFQNLYLDKTGILREVGVNYFVLEDTATHAMVMCDLYSARFVTSVS